MKTKVIILKVLTVFFLNLSCFAQTAAVSDISTQGVGLTPEIAGKLTRIELIKLEKYVVLDKFDMETALEGKGDFTNCYGKTCLTDMGKALEIDAIISGSIDKIGPKIVISLKVIDVKTAKLQSTKTIEFDDQEAEIPRMMEIVLREMFGMDVNEETKKRLAFNNEIITSTNVGKVSNAGPRFGVSVPALGDTYDFFVRGKRDGGLGSLPVMTNIGYQFEFQYVGTENFSALFEVIPNIGGIEQGNFIPTLSFLNGFRFGQGGWEFAFGPSFGAKRVAEGTYDTDGEWRLKSEFSDPTGMEFQKRLDTRGDLLFNTNWLMGLGRTFRAGALNIPVNMYYSGNNHGGVIGASVGFNIIKSKTQINQKF